VTIGWIFFRAENLNDAVVILSRILCFSDGTSALDGSLSMLGAPGLAWKVLLVVTFLIYDPLVHRMARGAYDASLNSNLKLAAFALLAAMIVLFGFWGEVEFIYFQF
jgi:alginate O-acetyltransferase complex protein AlgI